MHNRGGTCVAGEGSVHGDGGGGHVWQGVHAWQGRGGVCAGGEVGGVVCVMVAFMVVGWHAWRGGGMHGSGVCVAGGMHATPPTVDRMTDACKNITLLQTLFVGGNK